MKDEIGKLKTYFDSMAYEEKRCQCLDLEKGQNPFITVSRQAGAGGHALAEAILTEIGRQKDNPLFKGWQIFDQELCEMVSEEPGLKVSMQSLLSSEYHSQIEDMLTELIAGSSPQDAIAKRIFKIIRTVATAGKVIIVGRGGVCITRSLPLGIHFRLAASDLSRIKRMMKLLNVPQKKAKEFIAEQDKARAKLVKIFFNRDIADPLLYDATYNTDTVPVEQIARFAVEWIKDKSCHCQNAKLQKV